MLRPCCQQAPRTFCCCCCWDARISTCSVPPDNDVFRFGHSIDLRQRPSNHCHQQFQLAPLGSHPKEPASIHQPRHAFDRYQVTTKVKSEPMVDQRTSCVVLVRSSDDFTGVFSQHKHRNHILSHLSAQWMNTNHVSNC